MEKIIKIVAIVICLILLIPIIILPIPVKRVETQIDINIGSKQTLVKDEITQIYVSFFPEAPAWTVKGKDGVIFDDEFKKDRIFIVGNFPNEINYDIINNTFVFNGKYLGEKKRNDVIAGCFYVESWRVLGKLKRKNEGFFKFSKSSLTIYDYELGYLIPTFVNDLNEFEDVD